jgi:hypothetical protein
MRAACALRAPTLGECANKEIETVVRATLPAALRCRRRRCPRVPTTPLSARAHAYAQLGGRQESGDANDSPFTAAGAHRQHSPVRAHSARHASQMGVKMVSTALLDELVASPHKPVRRARPVVAAVALCRLRASSRALALTQPRARAAAVGFLFARRRRRRQPGRQRAAAYAGPQRLASQRHRPRLARQPAAAALARRAGAPARLRPAQQSHAPLGRRYADCSDMCADIAVRAAGHTVR